MRAFVARSYIAFYQNDTSRASTRVADRGRFQALLRNEGGAVVILDEQGSICHLTAPAKHFLARKTEQIRGRLFFSFVHRRDLYQVMHSNDRRIAILLQDLISLRPASSPQLHD